MASYGTNTCKDFEKKAIFFLKVCLSKKIFKFVFSIVDDLQVVPTY